MMVKACVCLISESDGDELALSPKEWIFADEYFDNKIKDHLCRYADVIDGNRHVFLDVMCVWAGQCGLLVPSELAEALRICGCGLRFRCYKQGCGVVSFFCEIFRFGTLPWSWGAGRGGKAKFKASLVLSGEPRDRWPKTFVGDGCDDDILGYLRKHQACVRGCTEAHLSCSFYFDGMFEHSFGRDVFVELDRLGLEFWIDFASTNGPSVKRLIGCVKYALSGQLGG